jgi:alpha-L-fucosidase
LACNENDKVKTPEQLFDLFLKSVGRGANLLLNIPPDRRGKIHANDSMSVVGLKKLIDKNLGHTLMKDKGVNVLFDKQDSIVISKNQHTVEIKNYLENSCNIIFDQPKEVNTIILREDLKYGQRVKNFVVQVLDEDKKKLLYTRNYNWPSTNIDLSKSKNSFYCYTIFGLIWESYDQWR